MKPDQERVRNLLTDTVTLLCKNGLQFSKELKVQGLLGITTDENDVFVVHINERFGDALGSTSVSIQPDVSSKQILEIAGVKQKVSSPSTQGRKRPAQNRSDNDSPPKKSASVLTKDTALSIKVKSEETEAEIFEVIDAGLNETSVDDDDRDAMRMTYSTPSGQLGEESSGGPSTVGETGTDQSQGQEQFLAFIKTQEAATNDVDGDDDDFGDQGWDNSALVQGGDSVEAAAGTSSTWTPRTPRTSGRHRKRNSRGADDMPCLSARKYRGKTKKYSHTQLEVAYKSVMEDGVPLTTAAKLHGIPKSTLQDKVKGRVKLNAQAGLASRVFTDVEEHKMVDCLMLADKVGYNYTKNELLTFASNFAIHLGKRAKGVQLGSYWIQMFLTRNPDLKVASASNLMPASKDAVAEYYKGLADLIKKYKCTSGKVYMVSEKEICLDHPSPCVLNTWSSRSWPAKRQKCVTLSAAVNTTGESVPPFFIVPSNSIDDTSLLEGFTPETGLTFSSTGASNVESMKAYITEHLAKHIKPPAGSHVLLLYDSPICPLPLEVQQVALKLGFVMYYVAPPQENELRADLLEPLGKTIKEKCVSFVQDQPECCFNTDTICHLVCKAYSEALTPANMEQAFQNIGIFDPVN